VESKIARVAKAIRDDISAGRLQPGQQLPSDRELAETYGVAVGTARGAVRLLTDEGWVVVTPSVGKFVTEERPNQPLSPEAVSQKLADLQAAIVELQERVDELEHVNGPSSPARE